MNRISPVARIQNVTRTMSVLLCVILSILSYPGHAASKPGQAAVASAHPLATAIGKEILQSGGNAFDAAVAVTAALAVVEPFGSGLGGGGFWLLHRESDKFQIMIDGRETAPQAAHRDMYLDKKGEVIPKASIDGALAAGIPGVPAAMVHIASQYGKLSLEKTLAPAIRIAKEGYNVDERYRRYAELRLKTIQASPEAARIFLHKNSVPPADYVLKQADLAKTLQLIATKGRQGFYQSEWTKKLVAGVKKAGGIWSEKDFHQYNIVERQPVSTTYKDMTLTTAALPSSGGIALVSMLNMLSHFDPGKLEPVERTHLLVEIMRRAYRDRAEYMGDPGFADVPVKKLTSQEHAADLIKSITPNKATPSSALRPVAPSSGAGNNTTHFSIMDKDGNRVSATLSINYPFGSGVVIPGTGFLLNDEMDDFSSKPGVPNAYGLIGTEANAIAPGKRPLSSMSPTFLESNNGVAILGTPGGSRIISMVLIGALAFFNGADANTIANTPRFHHQYLPDMIMYEDKAFSEKDLQQLSSFGHSMKRLMSPYGDGQSVYGNMQVIVWEKQKNKVSAASDKRGHGEASVF